jgi:hypothetical protein
MMACNVWNTAEHLLMEAANCSLVMQFELNAKY